MAGAGRRYGAEDQRDRGNALAVVPAPGPRHGASGDCEGGHRRGTERGKLGGRGTKSAPPSRMRFRCVTAKTPPLLGSGGGVTQNRKNRTQGGDGGAHTYKPPPATLYVCNGWKRRQVLRDSVTPLKKHLKTYMFIVL